MVQTHLPAWCERQAESQPDGRYTVACYYTRDGHPVSKARAERVEITEYAPDGTQLRVEEGVVDSRPRDQHEEIVFGSNPFQFSAQARH